MRMLHIFSSLKKKKKLLKRIHKLMSYNACELLNCDPPINSYDFHAYNVVAAY